jgi:hypothetical protein
MQKYWITVLGAIFAGAALLGFSASNATEIQPGYFEKQEAPAYGVSDDKALGSGMGKEFEDYFRNLYKEE